ncbi:hypothetical protein [Niabella drilacis]|uniref:Uncharacterized protein n=1 Tax=Niabella drilacis (strain DSM 25811 / CCM 8410 / CCUG 62505 / LMG 26954 / E90) TaxID=1285928 RepID=A0A1G6U794_NIADE|nr:hypothetical protein [Niabella drilacis]SDD37292.1 hypothetical protein SAMN04487894_108174 [Niabella drilacis]
MKKLFVITAFTFTVIQSANSQSYTETFIVCDRALTIQCEPTLETAIKTSIKQNDSILSSYYTWTTNTEVFAKNFLTHIKGITSLEDSCKTKDNEMLIFGRELLKNYLTNMLNTAPVAGTLIVNDSVYVWNAGIIDGRWRSKRKFTSRKKVLRLQAEINDGYLENIVAYIKIGTGTYKFTLPIPAGITSEENFKKFSRQSLFELKSPPYPITKKSKNRYSSDQVQYSIVLEDLLDYNYMLGPKRRDYSPKDTVLDMLGGTSVALHKEETKKLFEAQIYSDFEGLNAEKPNGLIQAEMSKRININSVQRLPLRFIYPTLGTWGYFQYIAPVASVNKVEANNKYLVLSDLDMFIEAAGETGSSTFDTNYHRYADVLSLYQHQWISAGTDWNLVYFNNHNLKYEVYLNVGGRFGLSAVSDSLTLKNNEGKLLKTGLVNNYSVSTLQFYPEIKLNFLPEERVCFSLSQKWVYFKTLSPTILQTSFKNNNPELMYPKSSSILGVSELAMGIRTNPNSRLFGRVRFNWETGNARSNFMQFQVGYATYILGNK